MDANEGLVVFEAVLNQIPVAERGEFASGVSRLLPELGATALDGANETSETNPMEAPIDAMSLLTPEQQEKAGKLTSAMAEKFGVDQEDFSILATETETGEQQFTVAYTAVNGLCKGSWIEICNSYSYNAKSFIIEVNGQKIDTRLGMTLDAYKAMVEQVRERGNLLPDNSRLTDEDYRSDVITLLTGEKESNFFVPGAFVGRVGRVLKTWLGPDFDKDEKGGVRFRPAAVIK